MRRRLWMVGLAVALAVSVTGVGGAAAYADSTSGSISGHLFTGGQAARTDVSVTLYDDHWSWLQQSHVDGTGAFQFTGLAPGAYLVQYTWADGIEQWYRSKTLDQQPDAVTVVAGQDTVADDTTLPTGTISGTLTDSTGTTLARVQFNAVSVTGGADSAGVTDDSGHFSIQALPGSYRVSFRVDGYPTDWVPQALSQDRATVFTVTADTVTTVNEQLPPTGTVTGRYTTADGQPAAHTLVGLSTLDSGFGGYTQTDDTGTYTLPHVFVGKYRVSFMDNGNEQFAYGKLQEADADVFTVTAGATTVVNDQELGSGSITVTALDAATGRPIANFCAGSDGVQACSAGAGTVQLAGVRQGSHAVYAYTQDGHYFDPDDQTVAVTAGATASVTFRMRPGATINAVVKDRATGAPIANTCLLPMTGPNFTLPDWNGFCSDEHGAVHIGPLNPGGYVLYTRAPTPYGDQWVGRAGGGGQPEKAYRITVRATDVVTAPTILLDHAGTVSGDVTDAATGKPAVNTLVSNSSVNPGTGPTGRTAYTDATGRYTVTGLGPYQWPLLFGPQSLPDQWSGGVPDRRAACPVTVRSDISTTYDVALAGGVTASGRVHRSDGTEITSGRVIAVNAVTGETVGAAELTAGTYSLPLLASQAVKLSVEDSTPGRHGGWYGGADFAHAKRIEIHRTDLALDLVVG